MAHVLESPFHTCFEPPSEGTPWDEFIHAHEMPTASDIDPTGGINDTLIDANDVWPAMDVPIVGASGGTSDSPLDPSGFQAQTANFQPPPEEPPIPCLASDAHSPSSTFREPELSPVLALRPAAPMPSGSRMVEFGVFDDDAVGSTTRYLTKAHPVQSQHHSRADWSKFKSIIHELYIDQNIALPDVIRIMADKHGFRASENMYKKRFRRWQWHKYNSKRHRKETRPASQPLRGKGRKGPSTLLLHQNDLMNHLGIFVRSTAQFIEGYVEVDTRWREESRFTYSELCYWPFLDDFRHVCGHFDKSEPLEGGRLLRHTFEMIGSSLHNLDPGLFQDVCISIPSLLIGVRRLEILDAFLRFIGGLAHQLPGGSRGRVQLAAAMRSALWLFQQERDCDQRLFLECLRRCFSESLSTRRRLRGGQLDLGMILTWHGADPSLHVVTRTELLELTRESDCFCDEAVDARSYTKPIIMILKSFILKVQWNCRLFLDDYFCRMKEILGSLERAIVEDPGKRLYYLVLYLSWSSRLLQTAPDSWEDKPLLGDKLCQFIAELDSLPIERIDILYSMELTLDRFGKHAEAERLHKRRLGLPLYQELRERYAPEEKKLRVEMSAGQL